MTDLKPISPEAIPRALEKVERYRLLNEPGEAESICRDVLRAEPGHQRAVVMLLLALTDQFPAGVSVNEPRALLEKIEDDYERAYYEGIIDERRGKALLKGGTPGAESGVHDWLRAAMRSFERAAELSRRATPTLPSGGTPAPGSFETGGSAPGRRTPSSSRWNKRLHPRGGRIPSPRGSRAVRGSEPAPGSGSSVRRQKP